MNINIKTKLYAGLGFLAFLIILLWGSGLVFINTLADNSRAIIQNNSRTVSYMQEMEQGLTELHLLSADELDGNQIDLSATKADSLQKHLLQTLSSQQQNITEEGEAELSNRLQRILMGYLNQFDQLRSEDKVNGELYRTMTQSYGDIQRILAQITYMNLDAIRQKNEQAQSTASNIILYMTIIGIISTLLALGLLIKYPNYVVHPIQELIDRIKNIANQNYDQRLEFKTGGEYEELAKAFNTMATRLQEYELSNLAKLKNEKQRIEAIINQMNEAVVGLDKNKNILFVNTKAEELTGINRDDVSGRYAPDVATKNDLMRKLISNLEDEIDGNDEGKEPDLIKVESTNRPIYYSKEVLPVLMSGETGKSDEQIGSIITLKNVTHFQEMYEAKTNFVAVVSHELKTPISSINMSLRLMRDERVGPLNEEQLDLVESIRNDVKRMKRTTSELLNLTKIETGNIQLNSQRARPSDLLEYAYETMIMQANQKNITIKIDCDEELSLVKADLQKSVWVLVNLISNAIRYTPSNGIIKMKAEDRPRTIRFSVIDNGKGIPEEYKDKVFQKYFQVHKEQSDSGGSGLGLAIAKEFINAQGGEIEVESELGEGSTFYFTLPKVKKIEENDSYEA